MDAKVCKFTCVALVLLASQLGCVHDRSELVSVDTDQSRANIYRDIEGLAYADWLAIVVPGDHQFYQGGSDPLAFWAISIDEDRKEFAVLFEFRVKDEKPTTWTFHSVYAEGNSRPQFGDYVQLLNRPAYAGEDREVYRENIGFIYRLPSDWPRAFFVGVSGQNEFIFSVPLLDDVQRRKLARQSQPRYDMGTDILGGE